MKYLQQHSRLTWIAGSLLALPTGYLIFASLLKFTLGIPGLFDAIEAPLNRMGDNQSLGWNINLLILFGPVLAVLLNLASVLQVHYSINKDEIKISASIKKSPLNIAVAIIASALLACLFLYMIGENCR